MVNHVAYAWFIVCVCVSQMMKLIVSYCWQIWKKKAIDFSVNGNKNGSTS